MGKMEFKYLVPKELLGVIREEMKPFVQYDHFADIMPNKQYTVRSVYYDSRRLDCYYDKLEGMEEKRKFRIRGYNAAHDHDAVFIEIKEKIGNFSEKARAQLTWQDIKTLFAPGKPARLPAVKNREEKGNLIRFMGHYYGKRLVPTVLITYDREAFCSRFDPSFRITFDLNVRSCLYPSLKGLYQDQGLKYAIPHYFVYELKFYRSMPLWARSILTRYKLPRMAISKYTICIDSHPFAKKLLRSWALMPES
jgi:VTC domain